MAHMLLFVPCSNARSATFSCEQGTHTLSTGSLVVRDDVVQLEADAAHRKCSLPRTHMQPNTCKRKTWPSTSSVG